MRGAGQSIELQSIRGLAAMLVLLHHCLSYYSLDAAFHHAAEILLNAHAAVVTFFVLSGYVLTLSLLRGGFDPGALRQFYLRRLFRIYPAIWLSSLCGLLAVAFVLGRWQVPNQSPWFAGLFSPGGFTFRNVFASFAGTGTYLNPPLWSIMVELVGSSLMPLFAVALRHRPMIFAGILLALAGVSFLDFGSLILVLTARYAVCFAIGASIVVWHAPFGRWFDRRGARLAALACVLLLLFFRTTGGWRFADEYNAPLPGLVESLAAALLMALVVGRRDAFAFLVARPLAFLGEISYSLYLLHFLVMAVVAELAGGWLGLPLFWGTPASAFLLALATAGLTLPAAALVYRWVELPCMALGRKWTAPRRAAAGNPG